MFKRILSCDDICIFLWNAPKWNIFIFGSFFRLKIIHVIFPQNPPFDCSKSLKSPIFPMIRIRWENGAVQSSYFKTWSRPRTNYVHNFETGKEPKLNTFDFGAFQRKMLMPSYYRILFHILFGIFHGFGCYSEYAQLYLN